MLLGALGVKTAYKCVGEIEAQVSISPTLYEQLLCQYIFVKNYQANL
jgi:hypothetical protein